VNVTVSQTDLSLGVQTVHRAVSPSSPVQALTGILMTAKDGNLRLCGSDSEISIEKTVPAQVEIPGGIILPARYVLDIVRKIPGGDIKISVDRANWTATITWGRSQFVVHGYEPTQFPSISFEGPHNAVEVPQNKLRDMIRKTVFAVAQNESRPILTGLLVELSKAELRLVAIDGVRLAYSKDAIVREDESVQKAVAPGKSMNELSRLFSGDPDATCKMSISDNQAFFDLGTTRFVSRLLEGQFPPYDQIVPAKFRTVITLNRQDLHDACERASLLSADNDKTIRMDAKEDLLVISSNTPEVGKVREEIECSVEGDPLEIAFNAKYLVEGLRVLDCEKVMFQANGAFSPCAIRPVDHDSSVYVAMPLRTLGDA
jgi:DNA polymerase III subunit beta